MSLSCQNDEQPSKKKRFESETSTYLSSFEPTPNLSPPNPSIQKREYEGCSSISNYKILNKIGEGTFGEVYKALDTRTNKLTALKKIIMHNQKEGIPITAIREIKLLKQLRHNNILPLIEMAIEKEQGKLYMVFPYMDHDLQGLLDNSKVKLLPSHIKTYLKQLLQGTAYLHHNRILHRDIKPANLLIDNRGILKIGDFGLARGIEDNDKEYTGCVVTRWYRPPELFLGEKKYTTALDMWGVGCIFGEMLIAKAILQGQDDFDQLKKIFYLCGSPTTDNWPNWEALPNSSIVRLEPISRRVVNLFVYYDLFGADLMDKLLVLDPAKRLTALEALEHDYFYTKPLSIDPSNLPHYEASHGYEQKKSRR